jgi:hypothetical protein
MFVIELKIAMRYLDRRLGIIPPCNAVSPMQNIHPHLLSSSLQQFMHSVNPSSPTKAHSTPSR